LSANFSLYCIVLYSVILGPQRPPIYTLLRLGATQAPYR